MMMDHTDNIFNIIQFILSNLAYMTESYLNLVLEWINFTNIVEVDIELLANLV